MVQFKRVACKVTQTGETKAQFVIRIGDILDSAGFSQQAIGFRFLAACTSTWENLFKLSKIYVDEELDTDRQAIMRWSNEGGAPKFS